MTRSTPTTQQPLILQQQQPQPDLRFINVGGGLSAGYNLGPGYSGGYDAFSCGSQCNEATDPCICLGRIFYILLAIIDVAILFLIKPFTIIKLLQLYSPELLGLLLENNLLKVAVNFGYVAIGSVAKWIIYYLNEDMIKDLHIEVEG